MAKKKNISDVKRIRIATSEIKNASIRGKFFKQKIKDSSSFISPLRSAPIEHYSLLIEQIEKYDGKSLMTEKKYQDILRNNLEYISLNSEYNWAKNILLRNTSKINSFIKLSSEYSIYLLHGKYPEALEILNKIEKDFGSSIWFLKNKIAYHQLSGGLEEQKKFTNSVKKELHNGSLLKFLIHWISVRNESQTTVGRFKNQIEIALNKLDPTKQLGYKEYLKFHLYDSELVSIDEMVQVLRISFSSSIIDYYEAFISLLYTFVVSTNPKDKVKALNFLSIHGDDFIDSRLEVLKVALGLENGSEYVDTYGINLFDKLLLGEISNLQECNEIGNPKCNLPGNILIKSFANSFASRSLTSSNDDNSLLKIIINGCSEILKRGIIDASKEYNELNKIAINFSDFSWSQTIKLLYCKENSLFANSTSGCLISVFKTGIIHPIFLDCVDSNEIYDFFEKSCNTFHNNSPSSVYNKVLRSLYYDEDIDSLYSPFKFYLKAISNFNKCGYEEAIKYGNELSKSNNGYFRRRGYGLISHSHLEMKNYGQACISAADCYLSEKFFYPFLPLNEIAIILKPGTKEWYDINNLVELPIILDACYKYTNRNIENPRRFAYEDFLMGLDIEKPSELQPLISVLDMPKIIYYLRYVCLENIMDTSGAFEGGSNEVINERLEICRFLVELDPINEAIYKQEIKEIVRRQVITSRRQEIDQSRIYVDVKNIKEWAEIELEESFDRYITYLKSGLDTFPLQSTKLTNDTSSIMNIPEDEVNELLRFMVDEIKKKYLSADFGLDRFISTRIRHGELERNMRIPIQKHNLITKKEVKNGPYLSNTFWLEKINSSPENYLLIDNAFRVFSENYDNLISKIANEWLQISSSEKPLGLFEFRFHDQDLQRIANSLNLTSTLHEFIDLVIRYLDSTLILLLVNIREELNNRGKQEAKQLLNNLNDNLFQKINLTTLELQRAIGQARTDLTAQFDKIIEWFYPSSEGNSSPYTIEDAILVAEAIIKEGTPNFKIHMFFNECDIFSIHGQLPIFIDIFINIFENVVKRSGLELPEANIYIYSEAINEGYFSTSMKISNNLGESIDIKTLDSTLTRIKGLLTNGSYSEYLATERNSGLLKIYRSVSDFSVIGASIQPQMDFGIIDDLFEIAISVPFKVFSLEQEESLAI